MKYKIKKEYIKTNLIGFIIAGIIVSGVAVYAAVTFPSNEVSYSNTESGLNSNNVQGAIDELYETCTKLPAGEQIIEDNGLEKDPYECRYFFTGATPNNYITFNNETWRIVSVECDGTIKIMRNELISDIIKWDTTNSNNWIRPATVNTYLNETFYNNLTLTAKNQIVSHDFSIGALKMRSENETLKDQIDNENSDIWTGKVGLIRVTEFIRGNSNQNECSTMYSLWEDIYYDRNVCKKTNWMLIKNYFYGTINPLNNNTYEIYTVNPDASLSWSNATTNARLRPIVYLSSDIKITGGNGSSSSPYTISL